MKVGTSLFLFTAAVKRWSEDSINPHQVKSGQRLVSPGGRTGPLSLLLGDGHYGSGRRSHLPLITEVRG